jgi:glycosyltransferase involved in cell wall biosynthesis
MCFTRLGGHASHQQWLRLTNGCSLGDPLRLVSKLADTDRTARFRACMQLDSITPLILTWNEAPNIGRALERLLWAQRIIVVDSFSSDSTLDILRRFKNVEVLSHEFRSFAAQCNFGLDQVRSEWVLSLDADYICSEALVREISALPEDPSESGFGVPFTYCVWGRPLKASLYPPRVVLYRRKAARYVDDGHAHRVVIQGKTGSLDSRISHDNRKSLNSWLDAQRRYADREVEKLKTTPASELSGADKLRKHRWIAPLIMPFYCLIAKGLILDGTAGLFYTFQRTYAELLLALRLLDIRLMDSVARNERKPTLPTSADR